MECRDTYHCLCAYLLDSELESEAVESIKADPRLCPRCRTCTYYNRRRQLKLQQNVRVLVQKRFSDVNMPDSLKRSVVFELGRAEEYRESGIEALGLIRWGTHMAQLYNTKNDLIEVLVPYIGSGLEENELCVWVTSEISAGEIRTALVEEIPNLQEYTDRGQLQLISYESWYSSVTGFDKQSALDSCLKKCQESLHDGYSGLRIIGNAPREEQSDWDSLVEYENLLDDAVSDYKMLIVCAYKESKCTMDNVVDIIDTHEYVIFKTDNLWRLRRSAEME